jgi:hypothetical protein
MTNCAHLPRTINATVTLAAHSIRFVCVPIVVFMRLAPFSRSYKPRVAAQLGAEYLSISPPRTCKRAPRRGC